MTKNLVNSDTFVILYYNPQMTEDSELMSLHAESSCQLLGGKPLHAQYPVFLFWNHTLFLYPLLLIRLTSHFFCGIVVFYKIWYWFLMWFKIVIHKNACNALWMFPSVAFVLTSKYVTT